MKLLCKVFGHKYELVRSEHIVFEVIDHNFKCSRCFHKKIITQRHALLSGWFPRFGTIFVNHGGEL